MVSSHYPCVRGKLSLEWGLDIPTPDQNRTNTLLMPRFLKLQDVGNVHNINLVTPEQ